jgi:hypothetical protein
VHDLHTMGRATVGLHEWDGVAAVDAGVRPSFRPVLAVTAAAALVVGLAGSARASMGVSRWARDGPPPAGTQSVVRGCASASPSVPGTGGLPPGWRSPAVGTIVGGPIAWPGHGRAVYPSGELGPHRGLAYGVKAIVEVTDRAVVRVVIPANEHARLSLDYTQVPPRDPRQNLYRVADGASQVTFKACSPAAGWGPQTQYAGGFLVPESNARASTSTRARATGRSDARSHSASPHAPAQRPVEDAGCG